MGAVHRMAASLDSEYEWVCGAFSADADRNRRSAEVLGLDPGRAYATFDKLLAAEAALPADERMEALAIVTPNHLHAPMAIAALRSEEHTSELQSLMRISYAVFCLKKKKHKQEKRTQS